MVAAQEGHVEIVKLLLDEVARISIKAHINTKDGKDMTALTWAKSEGREEVVSLLEKHTSEAPEAYTYYELLELKGG